MLYDRNESVHLSPLTRVAGTKKAILVKPVGAADDDAVWLPLSQIEGTNLRSNGAIGYVELPFWVAEDRGLDNYIVDPDDPNELPPNEPAQDVGEVPPPSASADDSDDDRPPF